MTPLNMKFPTLMAQLFYGNSKIKNEIGFLDIKPSDGMINVENFERIRISAAAYDCMPYKSFSDYLKIINGYFENAAKHHSSLLILPQLFGLSCVTIPWKGKKIIHNILSEEFTDIYLKDYISTMGKWNMNFYINCFSNFAKKYNMFVQPGSILFFENDKIYNRSFMFDNNGFIIGHQDKLFPNQHELNMGVSAGDTINIMKTPLGNFAILNGRDSTGFEVAKISKELGADIIISSCIKNDNISPELHAESVKWRCEEQNTYGIIPCSKYEKDNSIIFIAPYSLTENMDGILALENENNIKSYTFNYKKINANFNSYTSDKNYQFYQKYFNEIYNK